MTFPAWALTRKRGAPSLLLESSRRRFPSGLRTTASFGAAIDEVRRLRARAEAPAATRNPRRENFVLNVFMAVTSFAVFGHVAEPRNGKSGNDPRNNTN